MQSHYATLHMFNYPNYWETQTLDMRSFEEIIDTLDRLPRDQYKSIGKPILIFVIKGNGERFGLTVGGEMSTVILIRGDGEYWYSLGDPHAEGTSIFLCPDWTEISAKRLITHPNARRALRDWLENGAMSKSITWTDELVN